MSRSKADLEAELVSLREQIKTLQATFERRSPFDHALHDLISRAPVLYWSTNRDLRIHSATGGLVSGEVEGRTFSEVFTPTLNGSDPLVAAASALDGFAGHFSGRVQDCDVVGWIVPVLDAEGNTIGTAGLAIDETQRVIAEQEAANAADRYCTLFDSAREILFSHDFDGRIVSITGPVETLLGYEHEEVLGMDFEDLLAPESQPIYAQHMHALMAGVAPQTWEATGIGKTGRRVHLELRCRLYSRNGRVAGLEGVARDVSARKALEERVRQAQKMDTIGVLAGGIAHDFNNVLTGILGYAYLMQSEPGLSPTASEALSVIVQAGERGSQLTSQLLGFARRGRKEMGDVDVHIIIRDVVDLLNRTIDKRIRISTNLRAHPSTVRGDSGQIYQLLLNLCLNARDAMPRGGDLRINTHVSDENLVLAVTDTGVGMTAEVRDRIFEPFFTTKAPDKGTGMGLAVVYGVTKTHGGTVHVESAVGEGSTFYVALPLAHSGRTESGARSPAVAGHGKILVIDDDDVVRRVLSKMLRSLGYEVVTAGDSQSAVSYYATHYSGIDLVILDMNMPKMSGTDCFRALREINPAVRAVLSTGYSRDGDAEELLADGAIEFLQKPYQLGQLGAAVRNALTRKAAPL